MEWEDVTAEFSEEERHYKSLYLDTCEVLDGKIEASVFIAEPGSGDCEVYFSFGRFYGIVYADECSVYSVFDEVKDELQNEYEKHGEPSGDFINSFCKKHGVALPADLFFDTEAMFGF